MTEVLCYYWTLVPYWTQLIMTLENYTNSAGSALRLFHFNTSDRQQCAKTKQIMSETSQLIFGLPQGLNVGPVLFV